MKKNKIIKIGVIILIGSLFYFGKKEYLIFMMVANSSPNLYKVVEKSCKHRRGGSFVEITYFKGTKKIEYYGLKCFDLELGDSISLYYNSKFDFFYVPNDVTNKRYLIVLFGLLITLIIYLIIKSYKERKLPSSLDSSDFEGK